LLAYAAGLPSDGLFEEVIVHSQKVFSHSGMPARFSARTPSDRFGDRR
jgi:hypothetical protein